MNLIDAVVEQIRRDLDFGDLTALEEFLKDIPEEDLKSYLREEVEDA